MIEESPLCPHLNSNLKDFKRAITKENWDCVTANTGGEGVGKSSLSLYECSQVDENFSAKQVVDSQREFEDVTDTLDKGQAVLIDEGVHWLFNRNWNTQESKIAVGDLMVIRALNLFIVINIYSLRYLDIYLREGRLKFATEVKTYKKVINDNGKIYNTRGRGLFNFYTRRTIVNHFNPQKNWELKPLFQEYFPDIKKLEGGEKLWSEYEKKKEEYRKKRPRLKDIDEEKEQKELLKMGKRKLKGIYEEAAWARRADEY